MCMCINAYFFYINSLACVDTTINILSGRSIRVCIELIHMYMYVCKCKHMFLKISKFNSFAIYALPYFTHTYMRVCM